VKITTGCPHNDDFLNHAAPCSAQK
jgi:hypothetical protein